MATQVDIGERIELAETSRTYIFAEGQVRIEFVTELVVRESGSHRVRDGLGNLYVIAPGWLGIRIEDKKQDWTV